jgi:2-polyprenyl-3-methyl-5-hydroxy-6-metoxy-1,4-benzoquinol methylase
MSEGAYPYQDSVRQDILRMVPQDGKVIGSIGCGRAATEAVLVGQGRQVHGVDIANQAADVARSRLTDFRLIDPNERMPFAAASLDGLILADVLEHIPMACARLKSYADMLRPGGWMVISVPNMRYVEVLATLVIKGEWYEHPLGIFDETHVQVMTHRRLKRWGDHANLRLDRWGRTYDYRFIRRNVYRAIDVATFRVLHSFLTPGVYGVFRKV